MADIQTTQMAMGDDDKGWGDANRDREIRTEGGTSIMPAFMKKYAHLKCVKVAYQRVSAARAERNSAELTARSPVAEYIRRPVTPYDTATWKPDFLHFQPSQAVEVPEPLKVGRSVGTAQHHINDILIAGIRELNNCTTVTDTFESYRRTLHMYYKLGQPGAAIGNVTNYETNEYSDASTQTDLSTTGMQQTQQTQTETKIVHDNNCQTSMDQPAVIAENFSGNESTAISERKRFGFKWSEITTTLTSTALFGLTELFSSL